MKPNDWKRLYRLFLIRKYRAFKWCFDMYWEDRSGSHFVFSPPYPDNDNAFIATYNIRVKERP